MASFFNDWFRRFLGEEREHTNDYNAQSYHFLKGMSAQYDYNNKTYINQGYGFNPDVYAVIQQMTDKAVSVPYVIREVDEEQSFQKLKDLKKSTKGDLSISQRLQEIKLRATAFNEEDKPFPLEKPNPLQTWNDIFKLDKIYLRTTGNAYWLMISPEDGRNKDVPTMVYSLPAHLMKIVLKKDADLLYDENPISHYMLIDGQSYIKFKAKDVIHFKYPNPFWTLQGNHLYGLSPLKAALRNIESSNDALDQNVKTMKNSGVFGFLHSKDTPFTAEQAVQIKDKLNEMDSNPTRLSKIAGTSANLAFTRISLTTEELQPHNFIKHDQKTICNVLSWSDKLLNNDEGAKYDNMKTAMKMVVLNNLVPDFRIIEEKLNKEFLPKFKGYEKSIIEWDISELPEMQDDISTLIEWGRKAFLTPNEIRQMVKYAPLEIDGMDSVWIQAMQRIDEASLTIEDFDKAFSNE